MSGQTRSTSGARPMTRRELEAKIVARAWREPEFRNKLLVDPNAALQVELRDIDPSIVLPAALEVHVHVEMPNVYHLVLPRDPRNISLGELLGDNLEAVAPQTIAVITTTNGSSIFSPSSAVNVLLASATVANAIT